jgi:hypothetical protein
MIDQWDVLVEKPMTWIIDQLSISPKIELFAYGLYLI